MELNNLAQDYCIFEKLEKVLDLLEGGYNGEYDEDEEDEDEDGEEGEDEGDEEEVDYE